MFFYDFPKCIEIIVKFGIDTFRLKFDFVGYKMFVCLFVLCDSMELINVIAMDTSILQSNQHSQDQFDSTNTFSPKQTLTPITFAPTPSATSSSSTNFLASAEMVIFYIILGIVVVILTVAFIIYRFCKKKEIVITVNPNEVNVIEEMNQPLADNPNLPDEGLVQI